MAIDGSDDTLPGLEGPTLNKKYHSYLLSLPLEIREMIYIFLFANVSARVAEGNSSRPLAILQTSTRVRDEASSILYQRTPLRIDLIPPWRISILPPTSIIDRFPNVSFKVTRTVEFEKSFKLLTGVLNQSSMPRKTCHIGCELTMCDDEHFTSLFHEGFKLFMNFETLTIHFVGKFLRSDYFLEAVADDDPQKLLKMHTQIKWERRRRRQVSCLTKAEDIFLQLEEYLGKGKILGIPVSSDVPYQTTCVFHPLQHATEKRVLERR